MFVKCNNKKRKYFLSKIAILGTELTTTTTKNLNNNHDSEQFHIFSIHFIFKEEFSNHLVTCTHVNKHISVSHHSHCCFKIPQGEVRRHSRPTQQMFLNPRTWETACFLHLTKRCVQKCSTRVKYKATHLGFPHLKGLTRRRRFCVRHQVMVG